MIACKCHSACLFAGPEPSGLATGTRAGTPASAATAAGTPAPPDVNKVIQKVRAASPGVSAAAVGVEGPGAAVMAALEGDEEALLEAKGQEMQGEQVRGPVEMGPGERRRQPCEHVPQ